MADLCKQVSGNVRLAHRRLNIQAKSSVQKRTELFYINTIGEADTLPITCSLFPVPCYIVALRSAIAYTLIKGGL